LSLTEDGSDFPSAHRQKHLSQNVRTPRQLSLNPNVFNSPRSSHNVIFTANIFTANRLFTIQDVTPFTIFLFEILDTVDT